jgi:hypothetical protein
LIIPISRWPSMICIISYHPQIWANPTKQFTFTSTHFIASNIQNFFHPLVIHLKWMATTTMVGCKDIQSFMSTNQLTAYWVACCLSPRYLNSLSFWFRIISHWTLNLCTNLLTVVPMDLHSSVQHQLGKIQNSIKTCINVSIWKVQ